MLHLNRLRFYYIFNAAARTGSINAHRISIISRRKYAFEYDGCKKKVWENQLEFATKKFRGLRPNRFFAQHIKQ
jgi:hypothetical protein